MAKERMLVMLLMVIGMVLADLKDNDETFYNAPVIRRASSAQIGLASLEIRNGEQNALFSGLSYCPADVYTFPRDKDGAADALQRTSSCPWFWTLNYDSHRSPSVMLTAKCACHECQGPDVTSDFTCQPVYYFRKVKYVGDKQKYGEKLYPVPVGCTCNRYSTHDARSSTDAGMGAQEE